MQFFALHFGKAVNSFLPAYTQHPYSKMEQQPSPYENIMTNDPSSKLIRLLTLHPGNADEPLRGSLHMYSITEAPPYAALSYVWGKQISKQTILINGYPLEVTQNLDAALRHLRRNETIPVLWIDALCIDQESIRERNHQVPLMGTIYAQATTVLVWLGLSTDFSNWVMDSIASDLRIDDLLYPLLVCAMNEMLSRDWFSRVWVVQEVALASSDPVVICGTTSVPLSKFVDWIRREARIDDLVSGSCVDDQKIPGDYDVWRAIAKLDQDSGRAVTLRPTAQASSQKLNPRHIVEDVQFHHITILYEALPMLQRCSEIMKDYKNHSFSLLFLLTMDLKATDARDKAFALLGMKTFASQPGISSIRKIRMPLTFISEGAEKTVEFSADYNKSIAEVFSEVMAMLITERLGFAYSRFLLHTDLRDEAPDLPSWVPDLRLSAKAFRSTWEPWQKRRFSTDTFFHLPDAITRGQVPLSPSSFAEFSLDFKILYVEGTRLGKIIDVFHMNCVEGFLTNEQTQHLSQLAPFLQRHHIPLGRAICTLIGPSIPLLTNGIEDANPDLDCVFRNDFDALDHKLKQAWLACYQHRFHRNSLFITDTGCFGAATGGPRKNDLLAGLFGILNAPFVLRESPGGWSHMVSSARVAGHQVQVKSEDDLDDRHDFERFEIR